MSMQSKVIVTVTPDARQSYPKNPYYPKTIKETAEEIRRSVEAGASISHIHGPYTPEQSVQPDGKQLSTLDIDGWKELKEEIKARCNPIIAYGIASARLEEKSKLMDQGPDMMAICFTAHGEYFNLQKVEKPVQLYAVHPPQELEAYARLCIEKHVKPDIETFSLGAIWNLRFLEKRSLLHSPHWLTLFLGWPGSCWSPPTPDELIYRVRNLPSNCQWTVSVMGPDKVQIAGVLATAIILGGHVRVGMEDSPYLVNGELAKSNAELVEEVVRLTHQLGREVATPEEARAIIGLTKV